MFKKAVYALACLMLLGSVQSYAGETWKVTSLDWQPYSGSDLSNQGTSIQKLKELLSKEGINLVVEFYPWKRAQMLAKTKGYVGYFPAWPEEVYSGFTASPAVDWSVVGILKQTGKSVNFSTVDELFRKYKVGVVETYAYPKEFAEAMKKYPQNTDKAVDEATLLKKLSSGRDDVAITDPNVMNYLAAKSRISNIETVKIVTKKELVVAMRSDPENKKRIDLLNRLLKK